MRVVTEVLIFLLNLFKIFCFLIDGFESWKASCNTSAKIRIAEVDAGYLRYIFKNFWENAFSNWSLDYKAYVRTFKKTNWMFVVKLRIRWKLFSCILYFFGPKIIRNYYAWYKCSQTYFWILQSSLFERVQPVTWIFQYQNQKFSNNWLARFKWSLPG